jgi:hypothetical protein
LENKFANEYYAKGAIEAIMAVSNSNSKRKRILDKSIKK